MAKNEKRVDDATRRRREWDGENRIRGHVVFTNIRAAREDRIDFIRMAAEVPTTSWMEDEKNRREKKRRYQRAHRSISPFQKLYNVVPICASAYVVAIIMHEGLQLVRQIIRACFFS